MRLRPHFRRRGFAAKRNEPNSQSGCEETNRDPNVLGTCTQESLHLSEMRIVRSAAAACSSGRAKRFGFSRARNYLLWEISCVTRYFPGVPVTAIGTTAPAFFFLKNGASGLSNNDLKPVVA